MIFGRRKRRIERILVVEDEPLVAFDNEHSLSDAGFTVVATVDTVDGAVEALADGVDLVLADVSLSDGGDGIDVAKAAKARGTPLLFVTGGCPPEAQRYAVGCLAKPYTPRDLIAAIDAVDAMLAGDKVRRAPAGLTLYAPREA